MRKLCVFTAGLISGGYLIYKHKDELEKFIPEPIKQNVANVYNTNVKPYYDKGMVTFNKTKHDIEEFVAHTTEQIEDAVVEYGPTAQKAIKDATANLNKVIGEAVKKAEKAKATKK